MRYTKIIDHDTSNWRQWLFSHSVHMLTHPLLSEKQIPWLTGTLSCSSQSQSQISDDLGYLVQKHHSGFLFFMSMHIRWWMSLPRLARRSVDTYFKRFWKCFFWGQSTVCIKSKVGKNINDLQSKNLLKTFKKRTWGMLHRCFTSTS